MEGVPPLERITFYDGFDGFPMFSPDGEHLAFASNRFGIKAGGDEPVRGAVGRVSGRAASAGGAAARALRAACGAPTTAAPRPRLPGAPPTEKRASPSCRLRAGISTRPRPSPRSRR